MRQSIDRLEPGTNVSPHVVDALLRGQIPRGARINLVALLCLPIYLINSSAPHPLNGFWNVLGYLPHR